MIKEKICGVIFDLDGVIIDSFNVMRSAFIYAFNQFFPDKEAPFNEFIKHTGKGFLNIMDEMNLPRELFSYFSQKSIELTSEIKVFEGIESILAELKQNNKYVGISTGKDKYRTQLILKNKNLLSYFDAVVCSDEVKREKPHSASIDYHINRSGLSRRQVIFVGDSTSDIQCAHNSKVLSIAVLWGIGKRTDLLQENPDYLAYEMGDLKHILFEKEIFPYKCLN